jgi:hypothetical protein
VPLSSTSYTGGPIKGEISRPLLRVIETIEYTEGPETDQFYADLKARAESKLSEAKKPFVEGVQPSIGDPASRLPPQRSLLRRERALQCAHEGLLTSQSPAGADG